MSKPLFFEEQVGTKVNNNIMEKTELRDNIKKAIANEFEVEESDLTLDCDLKNTLDLDGLSLVDRLTDVGEDWVCTGLEVREDNIFLDHGVLRETGIIEHLAQSAAAMEQWRVLRDGGKVEIRYLCEVKNMEIVALPHVGEVLESSVEVMTCIGGVALAKCECRVGERMIAQGMIKIG